MLLSDEANSFSTWDGFGTNPWFPPARFLLVNKLIGGDQKTTFEGINVTEWGLGCKIHRSIDINTDVDTDINLLCSIFF